jgi:hypothetical protein
MSLSRSTTARLLAAAAVATFLVAAPPVSRAQSAGTPSAEDLSKQLANPVASLVSVPFQSNWEFGVGPEEKARYVLNFQPVMPFSLNDDWNLIARVIVPVVSQPPLVPGAESTFGLGDFVTSFFFSPVEGSIVWGVGPVLLVPVSADPFLGTEKWGAGPTAVVLKQMGPWTVGGLVNHIWSYGGSDDRDPVDQTFLQPFVTYATKTGYSFTLQTETTANWEAADGQRWTVPVNFLVGKVTTLGRRPISFQLGAGYYAEKPAGGPNWKLRANVTLLFPK